MTITTVTRARLTGRVSNSLPHLLLIITAGRRQTNRRILHNDRIQRRIRTLRRRTSQSTLHNSFLIARLMRLTSPLIMSSRFAIRQRPAQISLLRIICTTRRHQLSAPKKSSSTHSLTNPSLRISPTRSLITSMNLIRILNRRFKSILVDR